MLQQLALRIQFLNLREICNSQLSFSKEFHFAHGRGKEDMKLGWNDTIAEDSQNEMINYLMKVKPTQIIFTLGILNYTLTLQNSLL